MSDTVLWLAEERVIAGCVDQMSRIQQQIWQLHAYAEQEVANESGFRGVFSALRPALEDLTVATREVADRFGVRYGEVIGAMEQSARALRVCDEMVDVDFVRLATTTEAGR